MIEGESKQRSSGKEEQESRSRRPPSRVAIVSVASVGIAVHEVRNAELVQQIPRAAPSNVFHVSRVDFFAKFEFVVFVAEDLPGFAKSNARRLPWFCRASVEVDIVLLGFTLEASS